MISEYKTRFDEPPVTKFGSQEGRSSSAGELEPSAVPVTASGGGSQFGVPIVVVGEDEESLEDF